MIFIKNQSTKISSGAASNKKMYIQQQKNQQKEKATMEQEKIFANHVSD